jgi:hypothetical protein
MSMVVDAMKNGREDEENVRGCGSDKAYKRYEMVPAWECNFLTCREAECEMRPSEPFKVPRYTCHDLSGYESQ